MVRTQKNHPPTYSDPGQVTGIIVSLASRRRLAGGSNGTYDSPTDKLTETHFVVGRRLTAGGLDIQFTLELPMQNSDGSTTGSDSGSTEAFLNDVSADIKSAVGTEATSPFLDNFKSQVR